MPTRGKSSRPAAQNQSLRNAYSQFIEWPAIVSFFSLNVYPHQFRLQDAEGLHHRLSCGNPIRLYLGYLLQVTAQDVRRQAGTVRQGNTEPSKADREELEAAWGGRG